ncbi:hypothetical protein AAFF_G00343100 [Aldrovandia affinis]|uniref:Uncharacterized protein n=1 Tax=Aldrovandia affinis TaxID=143900 RepID=A0AAD7SKC8_9TELE|nr:hypothetical protein AAFF_G00343100 [Aldrovandia affinis]
MVNATMLAQPTLPQIASPGPWSTCNISTVQPRLVVHSTPFIASRTWAGSPRRLCGTGSRKTSRTESTCMWNASGRKSTVKAPLETFKVPEKRFDHVNVDLVGPLPPSRGFTYLLTMVDWTEGDWCQGHLVDVRPRPPVHL